MRKEQILNYLIETYLTELTPISSGELKRKCELSFSPSTIRNYFQKLDDEGLILKLHISSGSVPSNMALRHYWLENLGFNGSEISKENLQEVANQFDVFITIKEKENLTLNSILNIEDRFIILDFSNKEVVFRYSNELFRLLNELKGYSLENVKKFLKILKIDIKDKFSINKIENFNREFLYKHYKEFSIDSMFNEEIFENFSKGLSFNENYLIYKIDAFVDGKESEFIVLGDIHTNYINLFNSIKEVR